ncbi:hypothetical protein C4097_06790 [Clostridioides difficile]|uniref:hypothetical protein n=1 Tax=Clostridioides sp. ZZV15-6598 TaxID=2811501 RepID=UPI001D0F9118|nr:hypothetical protein [Clostridioides sp. ZZV15-6598]MDB3084266.1 hypothetical protein [Clostridioides difficile]
MNEVFIKGESICRVYDSRKYTIEQLSQKLGLKEDEIRIILHEYNYFNGKKLTPENTDRLLKPIVNGNKIDFVKSLSLNYINSLL